MLLLRRRAISSLRTIAFRIVDMPRVGNKHVKVKVQKIVILFFDVSFFVGVGDT